MADENTVNSSITITFATSSQSGNEIYVELDDTKHEVVYGSAKSSFLFGEKAYFSVYTNPVDLAFEILVSDGTLADEGSGLYVTPTDNLLIASFANVKTASLPKPTDSITSNAWLGNDLGTISYDRKTITLAEQGIGILQYAIQSVFSRKSLTLANPGGGITSYPVLVYLKEVIEEGA